MRSSGDQFGWVVKAGGLALLVLAAATAVSPGWFLKEVHQEAERRAKARVASRPITRGEAVEAAFSGQLLPILIGIPEPDRFSWRVECPRGVPASTYDSLEFEIVLLDEELNEWITLPVGSTTTLRFTELCPSLQTSIQRSHWRVQAQLGETLLRSAAMSITAKR